MINFKNLIFLLMLSGTVHAAPDGKALFNKHCSACHGNEGKGGVGIPLSLPSFINNVSDEYLNRTIRQGRPGRIMPAFKKMSDAQVKAVVSYMRKWADADEIRFDATPVSGNKVNGKKLFLDHCAQCHGEDGQGGRGTGKTFSRKRDLPIIAPALNNAGFLASASDMMIKNTLIHGREGTPMQPMLNGALKEKQINDVVSYVRSWQNDKKAPFSEESFESAIVVESPYSLDETVDNLKQAISNQNFKLIRTDYLDHGFVEKGGENKKQVILHFCNFKFLYDALSIDPRVGLFLPCRITVVEREGMVQMMTINPMRLSKLFNNDGLNESCETMTEIYKTILEDATL